MYGRGRPTRGNAHKSERQPVPVRKGMRQPQHAEAAGTQIGGVSQVDQDGGAAGADRAVQQSAQVRFGGRADLRMHLDHHAVGVAMDDERRGPPAPISRSARPQPVRHHVPPTGRECHRRTEGMRNAPRHGAP
ncbi:hypothetical protein GCM10022403_003360 [Streptomyces coacervatus]|uniref:Uncharacterized protein n=1 Tax=Streptomyces coacervatus TaxID=647381 RepID=A0ABP7GPI2_9ACTN